MATGMNGLLVWCKNITQNYENAPVSNMTTSWKNGLAFCAIIHYYRPDLIDYHSLSKENVAENNALAFRVAEEQLDIPALLDVEDMVKMSVPDKLSIMTYLSQYYNYFKDKTPGETTSHRASRKRPNERPHSLLIEKRKVDVKNTNTVPNACYSCGKVVYLMERMVVEGFMFHRLCFKCNTCGNLLKSTTYELSENKKFYCDKHSSDVVSGAPLVVDKPNEILSECVQQSVVKESTENLKATKEPLDAGPLKRNEVFTRRAIRPQSTPVDIDWNQANVIKSGENVFQSSRPKSSAPKTKNFLVNILKKKESEASNFDFSNPAYQHHLNLSAYMNKLNKSEPSLACTEEKTLFLKRFEEPTKLPVCIENVEMISNAKETSQSQDSLQTFKGECEQNTGMSGRKKKLVLRKKKKHSLNKSDSFAQQKSSARESSDLQLNTGSAAPGSMTACEEQPKVNDYENINNFAGESIPPEANYDNINLVKIIQPYHQSVNNPCDQNDDNYCEVEALSKEIEMHEDFNSLKVPNEQTSEDTQTTFKDNAMNNNPTTYSLAQDILTLSTKNETVIEEFSAKSPTKIKTNPFESSDSETELSKGALDKSNPFLWSTDNLQSENDCVVTVDNLIPTSQTSNPFLSDEDKNDSNPFLCSSSDEEETVTVVNTAEFLSDKISDGTLYTSTPISIKKRVAPQPPVSNPKVTAVVGIKKREAPKPPNTTFKNNILSKDIENDNLKPIIESHKSSSVSSQSIQELSVETINQPEYATVKKVSQASLAHSKNILNRSTSSEGNSDYFNKSTDSSRQSIRRKAPERPELPPAVFGDRDADHGKLLPDRLTKVESIETELKYIEHQQGILEMEGVEMEKKLRESQAGEPEDKYLMEWFQLINNKNKLLRRENELIYMLQEIQLLNKQREAEFQLRQLMSKPESFFKRSDQQLEKQLLDTILTLVAKRSAIVDRMDEERLREYEEDAEISMMLNSHGLNSPPKESVPPESIATSKNEKKKKKKFKKLKKK